MSFEMNVTRRCTADNSFRAATPHHQRLTEAFAWTNPTDSDHSRSPGVFPPGRLRRHLSSACYLTKINPNSLKDKSIGSLIPLPVGWAGHLRLRQLTPDSPKGPRLGARVGEGRKEQFNLEWKSCEKTAHLFPRLRWNLISCHFLNTSSSCLEEFVTEIGFVPR